MTDQPGPLMDDQAARQAIAHDLTTTLFVEAGAGSGKTTQMVARIAELVVSGRATVDQMAAITFTEAAAAELRDRVAGRLEREAAGAPSASRRNAATEALRGLDGAAVTTLHGFARRLLSEHPFAAGLPPVFEVLDEVRSSVAFDDRWAATLDALLEDPESSSAVEWLLAAGARLEDLRSLARTLEGNWDRVTAGSPGRPDPLPVIEVTPVLEPLRRAQLLATDCGDPHDRLRLHLHSLVPLIERLEDCSDPVATIRVLAGITTRLTAGNWGRASAWAGRKSEVQDLLAEGQAARDRLVATAGRAALARLSAALVVSTLAAADQRRREGRLEFHDLLVLARNLVRDDHRVCRAVADRYRYLLIDEFQDTDPIQAELAVRIAGADRGGADGEHRPAPEPGRLFFVGDPKQSIYRFRRADIALFVATKGQPANRVLSLTTNFRSTPGIVEWVDTVFARLIGAGGGETQPAYVPARPARPAPRGVGPAVTVLGLDSRPPARADQARALEAAELAAAVRSLREAPWLVDDQPRPATLADVTVLVPTRRAVPALQEAFDAADIPYRLESSSLVYAAPEVQDLLAILHAVDDPTDQLAVVAALRSAAFGCGDDDLVTFRLAGGHWDYRRDPPSDLPSDHPVVAGLAALGELHGRRWWDDVSVLVARVVDQRRLLPLALDGPRWRETWRRLRFVVDQARLFTESSPGDLRRFLAWVDLQAAEDARVTEVVLPESDVDAVRVMTVHAAKGLEFPVVALAGWGAEPRRWPGPGVLFGPDGPELAIRRELATPGYAALADREQELDREEQVRLLYVAATRARDHLVVSVHRAVGAEDSMAARLAEAGEASGWEPLAAAAPPPERSGPERMVGELPVPPRGEGRPVTVAAFGEPMATEADRAAWVQARTGRLATPPTTVSATGVAGLRHQDPGEEEGPGRPVWSRGRSGTALGRAVHATLQSVDLTTGAGLEELARAQSTAEGIGSRAGEVVRLVRAALDSEVVRGAVAGGRYWRELYVGTPQGDRVLEGFVDLLVEGPDGLEVVDYKTDQGPDDPAEVHRLQGAAYAVAIEGALGRPVRRCTFLRLRPEGSSAHSVADLEAAKTEVRRLLVDQ